MARKYPKSRNAEKKRWARETLMPSLRQLPERLPAFSTVSGLEIKEPLYTSADVENADYAKDILLQWESALYGAIMMGWATTLFFVDASHSERTTSIAEETGSTFLLNWRWYLKMDTMMLIHKRDTLLSPRFFDTYGTRSKTFVIMVNC
jgi:hypothetical protein